MIKKKVCIIGHFGFGKNLLNGQTIKTKIITTELEKQLGKDEIVKIDTHGGKKALVKLFFKSGNAVKNCKNVVIMPANNGLQFFSPILMFWKRFFYVKIHYIVIGGWLAEFITNKNGLQKKLKRFDAIYVETKTMKQKLEKMGFQNIIVMPNCKEFKIIKEDELIYFIDEPLKLCTFSRVMKEKGIEDAIAAVTKINEKYGRVIFTLDIYGQIDSGYEDAFTNIKKAFPEYIRYGGLIPFDKSVSVLKEYYALLFPTYYEGEGFAGTLIDALASGVPVIASDWKYNAELVEEGLTGFIFKNRDLGDLIDKLDMAHKQKKHFARMKKKCLSIATQYLPCNVIQIFMRNLE